MYGYFCLGGARTAPPSPRTAPAKPKGPVRNSNRLQASFFFFRSVGVCVSMSTAFTITPGVWASLRCRGVRLSISRQGWISTGVVCPPPGPDGGHTGYQYHMSHGVMPGLLLQHAVPPPLYHILHSLLLTHLIHLLYHAHHLLLSIHSSMFLLSASVRHSARCCARPSAALPFRAPCA